MTDLRPGQILQGPQHRYRLERLLGEGGFGSTWRARREADDLPVALKQLHVDRARDPKALELFRREAAVLRRLEHPRIPRHLDDFIAGGFVLVQQHIEGRDLGAALDGALSMDEPRLRAWLAELLDILTYLHGLAPPLIHRDITPKNILLTDAGAWLVDFGAVAVGPQQALSSTMLGTAGYAPMEQLMGRASPASDLYALGMTAVAVAAGRPAGGLPVTGIRVDVPGCTHLSPGLTALLTHLTAPDPADRPRAAEALARLRALADPAASTPATSTPRPPPEPRAPTGSPRPRRAPAAPRDLAQDPVNRPAAHREVARPAEEAPQRRFGVQALPGLLLGLLLLGVALRLALVATAPPDPTAPEAAAPTADPLADPGHTACLAGDRAACRAAFDHSCADFDLNLGVLGQRRTEALQKAACAAGVAQACLCRLYQAEAPRDLGTPPAANPQAALSAGLATCAHITGPEEIDLCDRAADRIDRHVWTAAAPAREWDAALDHLLRSCGPPGGPPPQPALCARALAWMREGHHRLKPLTEPLPALTQRLCSAPVADTGQRFHRDRLCAAAGDPCAALAAVELPAGLRHLSPATAGAPPPPPEAERPALAAGCYAAALGHFGGPPGVDFRGPRGPLPRDHGPLLAQLELACRGGHAPACAARASASARAQSRALHLYELDVACKTSNPDACATATGARAQPTPHPRYELESGWLQRDPVDGYRHWTIDCLTQPHGGCDAREAAHRAALADPTTRAAVEALAHDLMRALAPRCDQVQGQRETPSHRLCREALTLAEGRDLGAPRDAALRDRLATQVCEAGVGWGCVVRKRTLPKPSSGAAHETGQTP